MTITLANASGVDACTPDKNSVPAGPVTFTVKNESAAGITEVELLKDQRILGREGEPGAGPGPGERSPSRSTAARTRSTAPARDEDHIDFMVTGQAAAPPTGSAQTILAQGTKDYAAYVVGQIDSLTTAVGDLNTAVQAGNVDAGQGRLRQGPPVLRAVSESNVEGFVLPGFTARGQRGQPRLPHRHAGVDPVDPAVGWSGLHAIERDLWQGGAHHRPDQEVQHRPGRQRRQARRASSPTLEYSPEDLANGAADLIEEVQNGKITGEEEQFSHLDLVDFAANVEGAQQAYASLRPGLEKIDADLVSKLDQQFQSVQRDARRLPRPERARWLQAVHARAEGQRRRPS